MAVQRGKRAAAAFLACWMAFSMLLSTAWAADSTVTIATNLVEHTTAQTGLVWDDAWFKNDAAVYQQPLAAAALTLSASTYSAAYPSIENALKIAGFGGVKSYHYQLLDADEGTAAYSFGVKTVKDSGGKEVSLVAVVVRGTTEALEWAGNMDMGAGPDHNGFRKASDELLEKLEQYLKDAEITGDARKNAKILVTGHSRGASVANLTAARLTDSASKPQNIYAYTFAAAAVSINGTEEGYRNIFNIVRSDDLVTQVPLSGWGYRRYGLDLVLPGTDSEYYGPMNQTFTELTGQSYVPYQDPQAIHKITSALYGLAPTPDDANVELYSALLSKDIKRLNQLMLTKGLSAFQAAQRALQMSPDLLPLVEKESQGIVSAHCAAGYYSWLSVCDLTPVVQTPLQTVPQ